MCTDELMINLFNLFRVRTIKLLSHVEKHLGAWIEFLCIFNCRSGARTSTRFCVSYHTNNNDNCSSD